MDGSCFFTQMWTVVLLGGLKVEKCLRAVGCSCPVCKCGPRFPPLDYHLA